VTVHPFGCVRTVSRCYHNTPFFFKNTSPKVLHRTLPSSSTLNGRIVSGFVTDFRIALISYDLLHLFHHLLMSSSSSRSCSNSSLTYTQARTNLSEKGFLCTADTLYIPQQVAHLLFVEDNSKKHCCTSTRSTTFSNVSKVQKFLLFFKLVPPCKVHNLHINFHSFSQPNSQLSHSIHNLQLYVGTRSWKWSTFWTRALSLVMLLFNFHTRSKLQLLICAHPTHDKNMSGKISWKQPSTSSSLKRHGQSRQCRTGYGNQLSQRTLAPIIIKYIKIHLSNWRT
jgi:hypothetical protein